MRTLFTNRYQSALVILFWIFEILLVASALTMVCTSPGGFHRSFHPEPINFEAQIVWLASCAGVLLCSFLSIFSARPYTYIGLLTLAGVILILLILPYFGL
jgi:hypothetical protein